MPTCFASLLRRVLFSCTPETDKTIDVGTPSLVVVRSSSHGIEATTIAEMIRAETEAGDRV